MLLEYAKFKGIINVQNIKFKEATKPITPRRTCVFVYKLKNIRFIFVVHTPIRWVIQCKQDISSVVRTILLIPKIRCKTKEL